MSTYSTVTLWNATVLNGDWAGWPYHLFAFDDKIINHQLNWHNLKTFVVLYSLHVQNLYKYLFYHISLLNPRTCRTRNIMPISSWMIPMLKNFLTTGYALMWGIFITEIVERQQYTYKTLQSNFCQPSTWLSLDLLDLLWKTMVLYLYCGGFLDHFGITNKLGHYFRVHRPIL